MLHLCFPKLGRTETRGFIPDNLLWGDQHRSFTSLVGAFMFISCSVLINSKEPATLQLNVALSLQTACSSISLAYNTKVWLNMRLIKKLLIFFFFLLFFHCFILQKILFPHKEMVPHVEMAGLLFHACVLSHLILGFLPQKPVSKDKVNWYINFLWWHEIWLWLFPSNLTKGNVEEMWFNLSLGFSLNFKEEHFSYQ